VDSSVPIKAKSLYNCHMVAINPAALLSIDDIHRQQTAVRQSHKAQLQEAVVSMLIRGS